MLKNLVFPLAPLAEQERIVKRVEQLLGWCAALEAQLKSTEEERGRLVESVLVRTGRSEVESCWGPYINYTYSGTELHVIDELA